ncbi:MAG TPA: Crp/Fnr family transcriptional regulator [Hydrogenophaga sp.]|uniref:Crp/Fnr family transcriptional regulator n=1 Tax=Hydrogenophaga sp. TaxID=1904254 RepID=UPI002C7B756C|nr:Crp/Fnr family transcriptional regulator [Hydrogenophaga sp.]HMN92642.1 Crp/Fnr family transcriptional regulator [Hydrogenophaga sp.]HMP09225.1 Crp/Fnr family transcriptional regulator [Hydrogenophaga sp.]
MDAPHPDSLLQLYPALTGVAGLVAGLPALRVPAGTALFAEQAPCQGFPMVLEGEVRVSRSAPNGRELELYRVQPGQLCLVSSAALFDHRPLSAHGTTSTETALVLLPPPAFRQALADEAFRDFVLGLFAARMAELTSLIEAVAFHRLDARLAGALLGHGPQLQTTHQALADELGTVREIVTRLLRRFERQGLVGLSRECITIRDANGLRRLAAS